MTGERPPLFVVRGTATDEEVAALAAVLTALQASAGAASGTKRAPRSQWSAPERQVRRALHTGPGAWRASALPR